MHVLVDPLEIVPGRGGPPALRSRVPSILEALRAVSQPRLEGAAEEVPPESAHGNRASSPACCIPRGTGQSFAIRKKKLRAKIWSKLRRWLAARGLESRVNKLAARGLGRFTPIHIN